MQRGDLVASVPPELVVDIGPRSLDLAVRSGYDVGNLFLGCPSEKLCSCALRQAVSTRQLACAVASTHAHLV